MVSGTPAPAPLVLYDGECGFCDVSVQWLLRHDAGGVFRFAPLQGETAAAVLARHGELPAGLDSIVLVEGDPSGERVSWHSTAIFRILRQLRGPWRVLSWLAVLPRPLTDLVYRGFARIRHRVWGRLDSCRLPSATERARFLP